MNRRATLRGILVIGDLRLLIEDRLQSPIRDHQSQMS